MTFDEWLKYGVDNGSCSEQLCETHAGLPLSPTEVQLLDSDDGDFCINIVRLGTPETWETEAIGYLNAAGK